MKPFHNLKKIFIYIIMSAKLIASQADVQNSLTDINTSLSNQKSIVDATLVGQKRAVLLNDSSAKRTTQYTKIIIVVVVALVVSILLSVLSSFLPFIPSFVIDIIQIAIIAVAIIYGFLLYNDAQNRDKINFDELATPTITVPSEMDISANMIKARASGDLLGSVNLGTCVGFNCCSTGTYWDQGNSVCGNTKMPFTTISFAQKQGDIKPFMINTPNEFDKYAPV